MARPTTDGGSLLTPKTAGAFLVGIGVGLAVVSPVLPDALGAELAAFLSGGGSVILTGVGALALLMVLLAVFYQLYL